MRLYSVKAAQDRALQNHIHRAIGDAKTCHPDFAVSHPDECRDANKSNPDFTKLKARLTLEHKRHMQRVQARRDKIVGK